MLNCKGKLKKCEFKTHSSHLVRVCLEKMMNDIDDVWNIIARRKLNLGNDWEWRKGAWQDNGDLLLQMRQMPNGINYLSVIIKSKELQQT